MQKLLQHLPPGAMPYLSRWFGDFYIHINISRNRNSKLGDYRKLPDGSHKITVNHTLPPELFFFVLTHELAHLIAFERHQPKKIAPHGAEWKQTYREMLLESIGIYSEDLRPHILKYAKNPAANFSVSRDLVKYFRQEDGDSTVFVEDLAAGTKFLYNGQQYVMEHKLKKNYLCTNLSGGRKYTFKPAARVILL